MNLVSSRRKAFFLFFCLILVSAQAVFAGDETWRPVTPAELAMKTPLVDPEADAEAIFWEVRIDDSNSTKLFKEHYVRVKIFTERGREDFSKFDIPFRKGIKIKDIAARVIRPDGTIVEIQDKDIFEREIVKLNKAKINAKSFAVPNIEPGVIVEYRYREIFSYAGAVGLELEFQRDIPVQSLVYYYKPYKKKAPQYQSYNFTDTKFVEDNKGFFVARRTNVPAFKEEPYMPPENTVRPWMLLQGTTSEFAGVESSGFSLTILISRKDPSNMGKYWGAVAGERVRLVEFMNKKDKDISKTAEQLVASAPSDDEKLRRLYEFCQTEIRNVSFDPSMTDDAMDKLPEVRKISDVIKNKVGRMTYIDLVFGALANATGFETRLVLAANRSKMFFTPEMTNEDFIHQAAIAVKVGDGWKFFNPGVPFLPYGELVWYEEDVWSLLVGEKFNSWEKTPMTDEKKSKAKRTGKFKLSEDGTLEGTVNIEYTGQMAIDYRMENYDESAAKREEDLKKEIINRVNTGEVSDLAIENLTDAKLPLVHRYKVRIPNYAQRTGKRLFLQPGFFEHGEKPRFSSESRKYDIYFEYPWSEQDVVEIETPAGFSLDSADAPGVLNDEQKISFLKVDMQFDRGSNKLFYNREFYFGGGGFTLFPESSYAPLKQLFDEFHKSNQHTVTFKQD